MKYYKFVPVLFMLFLFAVPTIVAAEGEAGECYQQLENNCQKCHMLGRVCGKLEKKSERAWKKTVTRMVERRGAKVDAQQQAAIVKCLATRDASVVQGCKQ